MRPPPSPGWGELVWPCQSGCHPSCRGVGRTPGDDGARDGPAGLTTRLGSAPRVARRTPTRPGAAERLGARRVQDPQRCRRDDRPAPPLAAVLSNPRVQSRPFVGCDFSRAAPISWECGFCALPGGRGDLPAGRVVTGQRRSPSDRRRHRAGRPDAALSVWGPLR